MYPLWVYYPKNRKPPDWVTDFVGVVADAREQIDTEHGNTKSDTVLKELAPGLSAMGFAVEVGKKHSEKIRRPVLFGDEGRPELTYDIDAFHDQLGIAVEIEAGRGAQNNADYRDLIRASLLLDARFLVLVMPNSYHFQSGGKPTKTAAYSNTRNQMNAVYASRRLELPFDGVVLVGY